MACPGSFLSSHRENHPDHLSPDKLSCRGGGGGGGGRPYIFVHLFPRLPTFAANPRIVESAIGSAPVEHPHYTIDA